MRRPVREGAIALAAVALLASCSAGPKGDGDGSESSASARPSRKALDLSGDPRAAAPLAFDSKAAHVLPTGPKGNPTIALYGRAAWLSHSSGVTVYDLTTGRAVSTVTTRNTPMYDLPAPGEMSKKQAELVRDRVSFPVPVRIGGVPAMVTVVPVRLAAKGTGKAQAGFEVIAARADDGKPIWRLPVDIYGDPVGKLGALQVSTGDGVATVTWTDDGYPTGTFAISLDEPRLLWQRAGFWKVGGSGDAVLGFREEPDEDYSLAGVGATDGRDLWVKEVPAGALWAIRSNGAPLAKLDDDSEQSRLIEIATGDFALSKRGGLTKGMDCEHDDEGTVQLCASKKDGAVAVDDAGKVLWRRAAGAGPGDWNGTVEAEFKDLFYVKGKEGAFVVDGRTGRTVSADAGVVPDRVSAYAALVYTDTGTEVHLAER
ncbi:hypothetical protein [Streptomyces muensis]|uniref:Lipoprotein n=1 Tax=Streptomyces muensis TaxID=1077944 RepID=A0A9X1Q844_STRM4|nr:hypothetical protein [Streptomyces muensis]MCF1599654.1 hypothetical protein [Streptomyces muensis]